jgi:hypothetical protein
VYVQAITSKAPIVQETVAMAKKYAAQEGATVKHAPAPKAAAAPRAPRAPRAAHVAPESPRYPHRDETFFPAVGPRAPRPVPGGLPFQPSHVPARVPYDRPALPPMPRPRPVPSGRRSSHQPPHVPRRPAPAPAPAPSGGGDAAMMAMFEKLLANVIAKRPAK